MAVQVATPERKEEDPLGRIAKLVSIGTSIAGMGKGKTATPDPTQAVSDTTNFGGAMERRMNAMKKVYV